MTEGPQGEPASLPIALLVAPCAGRLRILPPKQFQGGSEWVEPGQPVAQIEHAGGDPEPVLAPYRGRLGGIMGRDGEPVKAGQPVAWMEAIREPAALIKAVEERTA